MTYHLVSIRSYIISYNKLIKSYKFNYNLKRTYDKLIEFFLGVFERTLY